MKKYMLGLIALVLAVGLSSFDAKQRAGDDTYYFKNTGTSGSPIWVLLGTTEPNPFSDCNSDDNYCYGESTSENGTVGNFRPGSYIGK